MTYLCIYLFILRGKGDIAISIKELRVVIGGTREYLKGRDAL